MEKKEWTEGGQRVGGFARLVNENDCSGFPAGRKGVRRTEPVEDGEKMLLG